MDTLEFLRERVRMCKLYSDSYNGCCECPLAESRCVISNTASDEDLKKMITAVEQWSKEHPRKTMQSVFLEQWPDAIISYDGLPEVAPCQLCVGLIHGKSTGDCEKRGLCAKCRREFWMQEVE